MAKSAALNPASMPFFPGALRASADDDRALSGLVTFGQAQHGVDPSVVSDYLSARSTPSPPSSSQEVRQQSPLQPDKDRRSPAIRQSDAVKPYPGIESRVFREGSMVGTLGTLPEKDEGPYAEDEHISQSPPSNYRQQQQSEQALPVGLGSFGRSLSVATLSSASPVSLSNDSNSRATPILDPFEAQLRASPLFHDILDRLVRCELVSREIQRDMSDLNRKVNILIERSVLNNNQPEFKDPFASSPVNPLQQRPSMGNIAPNQAASTDDTSSISQRLNTLTSSVGQLLALQTQQIQHQQQQQQNISPAESRSSIIGLGNTNPQLDISPNHILSPSGLVNAAMLSHLPNRPQDMRSASRPQNPSVRMWSSGSLELPVRPGQDLGRQDSMLRDKRRSSGLLRRDSAGVFEPQGDLLSGNGIRDNGPMVTKWDQLNLAPELLRSLSKFGVGPPNKIQQRALPFLLRGSDIIAQAPPTQERIAAYVIPAIQVAFAHMATRRNRGPIVIMVSTTLDQATQAQRMIRDLGGPIGVKSALGVGITPVNSELLQEIRVLQQNVPHIICGTPQKLHALFTTPGGLSGSEVRFLVLDEVDQLIARNLHEFVFNIVKLLPPPRSRPSTSITPGGSSTPIPGASATINSPFEQGNVMSALQPSGRRFSAAVPSPTPPLDGVSPTSSSSVNQVVIERQTALFSNTVPQDVLNLASAIHLREPVRVLVRRDGNVSNTETNPSARGLRQFYLYLAFQAGGRGDPMASSAAGGAGGLGIIGSGRSSSSAETTQAREWKLDALADLLDDVEVNHAVVHVGGMTALDAVVYKLASRGFEPIPLHGDMNSVTRVSALNKFRTASTILRQPSMKALVVYDVLLKGGETPHIPLVINYDLPKAVEEYSQRVAPAMASNYSRAGVVINFVTATGGDVEMLRSIECFYKIKCPEVPMSLRDIV